MATVASATRSHSHHVPDRSLLAPANCEPADGNFGAKAADGAAAGAGVVLPLPSAGRLSMEADALLPDLFGKAPEEEEDWGPGANACLGAITGLVMFMPEPALSSADAPSTEAAPLPPITPDEGD